MASEVEVSKAVGFVRFWLGLKAGLCVLDGEDWASYFIWLNLSDFTRRQLEVSAQLLHRVRRASRARLITTLRFQSPGSGCQRYLPCFVPVVGSGSCLASPLGNPKLRAQPSPTAHRGRLRGKDLGACQRRQVFPVRREKKWVLEGGRAMRTRWGGDGMGRGPGWLPWEEGGEALGGPPGLGFPASLLARLHRGEGRR